MSYIKVKYEKKKIRWGACVKVNTLIFFYYYNAIIDFSK
jgi:hypothetical protein